MQQLILLVVVLPFVSVVIARCFPQAVARRRVAAVSVTFSWLTFVAALIALWTALDGAAIQEFRVFSNWGIIQFDPLSTLMALVISAISLVVHIYSVRYMAEESRYSRFFMLLDAMTGALLLMVSAGDLLTLLIAWHLVGVLLYFLLGFDTRSLPAQRYAFWTWMTYRFGDLPLVLAAILLYQAFGSWSLSEVFTGLTQNPQAKTFFELPLAEVVAGLVAVAAFARSAQFFLHTWLPYTMSGPTPVSALMHAGIVNAGGFLINRFAPLYVEAGLVLHWLFVVGLVTAILGSVLMLVQNDIKKALGYSTMGQMGFMIMECGVGAFSLAIFHLIAHGLFKGTLFLGSGGVIGEARVKDGVPKDPLYQFVVKKRTAKSKKPWLPMAVITVLVPLSILIMAHWLVAQDYFHQQGAIVLLFFGWVTGAQLIFSAYRLYTQSLLRLLVLVIVSFAIVVFGYALISHAFEQFLYPDEAMHAKIYLAAAIDVVWFDAMVVLVSAVILIAWLSAYYSERRGRSGSKSKIPFGLWFYSLASHDFYVSECYSFIARIFERLATRLNIWLRWI